MRSVPVDIQTFMTHVETPVGIDPVVDFDTGEHRKDNQGTPKWKLTVLYREPGRKRELVEIGFAAPNAPEAEPGATLIVQGLTARHWENTNKYGTSSGITLSADRIGFKPATGTAKAAA